MRNSWATGESIQWIRVHDLPDYVYFNHEIHVNKGIGCASCHGRVDEMPLMYEENTLQMEWCLNCHRNPAVNLRPTAEIYNMAWAGPASNKPVWCTTTGKPGPTSGDRLLHDDGSGDWTESGDWRRLSRRHLLVRAQPQSGTNLQPHPLSEPGSVSDVPVIAMPANYQKFTSQIDLGHYLMEQYHIRSANELSSCETCHR